MASLYIKDNEANALAESLARRRGVTKTAAVKLALIHELARDDGGVGTRPSAREVMEHYWRDHPPPGPDAPVVDKAFYDSLSDQEDD